MIKKMYIIFPCVLLFLLSSGCTLVYDSEPTVDELTQPTVDVSTPLITPVNLTLNATKFDADGNEIGTAEIPVLLNETGDYFQDGILDIEIQAFDGHGSYATYVNQATGVKGEITVFYNKIYKLTLYTITDKGMEPCTLYFTDIFDCFVLKDGTYTYLASAGDNHTADKVLDHFKALNFNPLPSK